MDVIPITFPKQSDRVWDRDVPIVQKDRYTHVYLTGDIEAPFLYNEICYLLQEAQEHEIFVFHITTSGGDLDSAIRLLDAMRNSRAYIIGNLAGTVASAGTMITMGCHEIQMAPHTGFMIHYYSAHVQGKGHELKKRQDFMNGLLENLMYDVYKGFLTDEEIEQTIKGEDFWMDAEEVLKRWGLRQSVLFDSPLPDHALHSNDKTEEKVTEYVQ